MSELKDVTEEKTTEIIDWAMEEDKKEESKRR